METLKYLYKIKIILYFFFLAHHLFSQILPEERSVDWKVSGNKSDLTNYWTINILDYGGLGDGISYNDNAINQAIDESKNKAVIIYFPAGIYKFTSPIYLNNNTILSGASAEVTVLDFDLNKKNSLINVIGSQTKDTLIIEEIKKSSNIVVVNNSDKLAEGDYFQIIPDDNSLITSSWALHTSGQICKVNHINQDTLFLESPVRRDYGQNENPVLIKIIPKENIGIEKLKIIRRDSTPSQTDNIHIDLAVNSFVDCIESENCNFAHIGIRRSSNIEIKGSYFHDAFSYGGGGRAYGVAIQSASGECLVENNIIKHLRHSMLVQSGSNGNVFCYNYSLETYWTDVMLPSNSAGDIVLHGNYPYCNLYEGNIVQNIVIDNSHGKNGPYNTFFRNRAELYGIFMNSNPASDRQNFIGNEITNEEMLKGMYLLEGENHFEYGNNVRGAIKPEGTNNLTDKSYYFDKSPQYYKNNSHWSPIGIPNKINEYSIEAKDRYLLGIYTHCSYKNGTNINETSEIQIKLNSAGNYFSVQSQNSIKKINIYNILGVLVFSIDKQNHFSIEELAAGIYFIEITVSNNMTKVFKVARG